MMAKAKPSKVGVTTRAVIQRINRKLADQDEALKTARSERMRQQVGDYYVLDLRINGILHHDVDPAAMAREMGLLKAWERVID
jgi:hypothetical protein